MLDVSKNRSFQQYYGDKIDEWIAEAIEDVQKRTKAGNVKRPSYRPVTDICNDFAKKIKPNMITKSFEICGVVGNNYNIDILHEPLYKLFPGQKHNEEEIINFKNDDQI
ncbi:hypothetical protein DMUE_0196 [Dictyocoela muelleri]|nr:hypothetical protein DMUE_0196 [Dictyocoela muelleri]